MVHAEVAVEGKRVPSTRALHFVMHLTSHSPSALCTFGALTSANTYALRTRTIVWTVEYASNWFCLVCYWRLNICSRCRHARLDQQAQRHSDVLSDLVPGRARRGVVGCMLLDMYSGHVATLDARLFRTKTRPDCPKHASRACNS